MPLIDTEVLANWIDGSQRLDTEHDYEEVARYIEECPTVDAVPVVRCWECDMWNEDDFSGRKSLGNYRCACDEWSDHENGRRVYTGPDEFCSRGERKGGDDDV